MSRLVLATYNVHRCVGRDRRRDPERIARVVRELDADVIALQEVEFEHEGERPPLLDGLDEYEVHLGPTLRRGSGHYGNALLARHVTRSVQHVDLSHGRREARGALDVVLDLALGDRLVELRVVATHLGLSPRERRSQVERLLERIAPGDGCAQTALLGDFNEWRAGARTLRSIERSFGTAPRVASWPSRRPLLALDRIWIRPRDALLELAVHDSPLARMASDHLPVRALVDCASWPRTPADGA